MKTLRTLFISSLVLALFPISAFAKPSDEFIPDDVTEEHWANNEITEFMNAEIIDGTTEYDEEEDYTYVWVNPEANITRAQFTKMMVNALHLKVNDTAPTFADVKSTHWFAPYVEIASSNGIIKGTNGYFNPSQPITREQMALMIYRAFKTSVAFNPVTKNFKDVPVGTESDEAIHRSAANGIIKGYGDTFKPKNLATRAQAIVMIHRALHQETSDLPNDQQLQLFVQEYTTKEREYLVTGNYPALDALYQQYETGYALASSEDNGFDDLGTEMALQFESIGEFNVEITSTNNRFAVVAVNNLKYKMSYEQEGTGGYTTLDLSGKAHLKKDEEGNWKIYNYSYNLEELN